MASYLLYLPIYVILLKRNAPNLYDELGRISMFFPISINNVVYFFWEKRYTTSKNAKIITHGKFLTWTLGYAGVLILTSFIALILLHFIFIKK